MARGTKHFLVDEPQQNISIQRHGVEYQKWLQKQVGAKGYKHLFRLLHETEFTWVIPFDENRAEEGIALRYRFDQERNYIHQDIGDTYPCSVLEMLIAFAIDIEEGIMYDSARGDRTADWFWMMIDNLGINYNDRAFDDCWDLGEDLRNHICDRLDAFLVRDIDYNGEGGLFPLRRARMDQRDEDLWMQANTYVIEELL